MDNNGNFEQQFTQDLKTVAPAPVKAPSTGSNKVLLAITIALTVITLVESIALVITLSNYFSIVNGEDDAAYEIPSEEGYANEAYTYDDEYNLISVNLDCVAEDGAAYELRADNKFEQYNGAGSLAASGPYTITNDSLISLSGSNKVLYYDGFEIADGLTIYTCKEVATEADIDDSETE